MMVLVTHNFLFSGTNTHKPSSKIHHEHLAAFSDKHLAVIYKTVLTFSVSSHYIFLVCECVCDWSALGPWRKVKTAIQAYAIYYFTLDWLAQKCVEVSLGNPTLLLEILGACQGLLMYGWMGLSVKDFEPLRKVERHHTRIRRLLVHVPSVGRDLL